MTITLQQAPTPAPATPSNLWRNRNFTLLWIGETTSKVGSRISSVAVPLVAVTVLDATTLQVGLLAAASWLPWLLIGLPAGAWVDRLRRRPLMLACNIISMLLMVSVPISAWLGVLSVAQLLVIALLAGTAEVFFQTAFSVFVPTILDTDDVPRGNARLHGSASAADVAGPGAAGAITQLAGVLGGFVIDALTFAVAAVCLARIRVHETPAPSIRKRSLRKEIAEGMRYLVHDPYLRVIAISGAVCNLALIGYNAILVLFLVREVGVTPAVLGLVLMGMSAGGVIGAASAARLARRFGSARTILLTNLGCGPFALLIPLTGPGWRLGFVIVGGAAIGAGIVAGNVLKSSFRQTYTPRELLGRVTVSSQFLNYGTIPLGALLAGTLGEAFGIRPVMWIMTVGVALAPLTLLIGPMKHRLDLPTTPR